VGVGPARRDVLVAEEGDRVVGFAALDAPSGEVTAVYVDPAAWRLSAAVSSTGSDDRAAPRCRDGASRPRR
jgi:hypothetical protein